MQTYVNLLDLVESFQTQFLLGKIGFDTAENGPSKVRVTGVLLYRYRFAGMPIQAPLSEQLSSSSEKSRETARIFRSRVGIGTGVSGKKHTIGLVNDR